MARIPGGLKLAGAGLGLAAVIGFVAWAVDEADERRKRAARAQQFVRDAVAAVAGVLGRPVPVVTFDTGCPNAWTNQRTICFNTAWAVNELTASCGADVCAWNRILAVVAHEFGHMINPNLRRGHPWDDEYYADRVAGWVMGKLGIAPNDFLVVLNSWPGSNTHPPGSHRVRKVAEGYQEVVAVAFAWS